MNLHAGLVALVSVLLAGCVNGPLGLAPSSEVANGTAELRLTPQIVPGGLAIQAVVDNYTTTNIDHLVIKLFKVNGSEVPVLDGNGDPLAKDIPNARLSTAIAFSHLNANTTYRIRAYAYKASGTAEADLISTADVNSYTDVTVGTDDRPTLSNLRVKLIDKAFNGQATASGVVVTSGGLVTTTPEAIN